MVRETLAENPLPSIARALWRHRRRAILTFVGVLFVAGVWTLLSPKSYRAEGKLFIRLGRENALIDATATLGRESIVAIPQSRDNEINSVVELMRSRGLMEAVVDHLTPAVVLDRLVAPVPAESEPARIALVSTTTVVEAAGDGPEVAQAAAADVDPAAAADGSSVSGSSWGIGAFFSAIGRGLAALSPFPALDDRERAVLLMQKKLDIEGVKRSNVVQIQYEAPSPELAKQVVAKLIECYLEEHIRLNRTGGAREFLGEQTQHARVELASAEDDLRMLQTGSGLISPQSQREILVQRVGKLEEELLQNTSETAASRTKLDQLRRTLAALPVKEVTNESSGMPDLGTDEMRSQFYALQLQEQAARAKYTENHPRLKEVMPQTQEARRILDREKPSRNHVVTAPSKVNEEVRVAIAMQEAQIAALEAKAAGVHGQLAEVRKDLLKLADGSVVVAKAQREFDMRETEYRKYALSLEQARIDDALERQKISNISVAQQATCSLKPVKPRMAVNLGLGLLAALMSGVGVALVSEMRDRTLRTAEHVERQLGLPVLATVPRWHAAHPVVNGRN